MVTEGSPVALIFISLYRSLIQYCTTKFLAVPPGEVQEMVALFPEGMALTWVAGFRLSEEGCDFRKYYDLLYVIYCIRKGYLVHGFLRGQGLKKRGCR